MSIQKNIKKVASHIKSQVRERDEVIDGIFTAMLSGHHVVQLGSPGEAKSLIARLICESLKGQSGQGNEYFEWLLTRFSVPEEIFGSLSLKSLESNDQYIRKTENKLPAAKISFLDEIFKANSGILNSLLTVLNEGLYHNGDKGAMKTDLLCCIAASNEYPEKDCAALWDRFLVRFWIEEIKGEDSFLDIIDPNTQGATPLAGVVSVEDIKKARAEVSAVAFPRDTLSVMSEIKAEMKKLGVRVSTRRWKQATKYVQAKAYYDGDSEVTSDTFMCLADVLWSEHKERPAIRKALLKVCNPVMVEATEYFDAMTELLSESSKRDDEDVISYGVRCGGIHEEMLKVRDRLSRLGESKKLDAMVEKANGMLESVKKQALQAAGIV